MANVYGYSQTGSVPANMVTTNTSQVVSASKVFSNSTNVFFGDGSNLTGVEAELPVNGVTTNTVQTITAQKTFSSATNSFTGNGAGLTNVPLPSTGVTTNTFQVISARKNFVTPSVGATANPTISVHENTTSQGFNIIANCTAGGYNTIVQADDGLIIGTGISSVQNTKSLVVASHSSLTSGLRVTPSTVLIGVGGTTATPTNNILVNTTNTTVTGAAVFSANVQAATFTGDGSGLTNVVHVSETETVTGAKTFSSLDGTTLGGPLFGRNDTIANIFSGTLTYARHPIGWTIKVSKAVSSFTSASMTNVIANGTATTAFTTLSNGVWKFGCAFNNVTVSGNLTGGNLIVGWNAPTGGTILNGTAATAAPGNQANTLHYYTNAGLNVFGKSVPEAIIQFTGNGTTNINLNLYCTYTSVPTITFNIWAIKIA